MSRYKTDITNCISRQAAIDAIDVLKRNYPSSCFEDLCKAVDVAIKSLSARLLEDGDGKDDDVTCDKCEYSEKYIDGLILCRRTKTSHRVSATSTCGKGKR